MVPNPTPNRLCSPSHLCLNTLRPRQNGRHFPDDVFKWIFLNENVRISIEISFKFVPKGPINNIPLLVQIMAWRLPGDTPLSEQMVVRLLMHICVSRPQWVKLNYHWVSVDPDLCCHMVSLGQNELTLKHRETHGCVVSTVAIDALVLKHQAISIHNAD